MITAYKNGANWCNYGWSDNQMALYPIQKDYWNKLQKNNATKNTCGDPGINGGKFENKYYKFGANCYGKRPKPKGNELDKNLLQARKFNPIEHQTYIYKQTKDNIKIAPHSNKKWYK